MQVETISANPDVQARYESMRLAGQSHNMAEILATRAFPGMRTDSTFLKGRCNGNQFEDCPGLGDEYQKVADEYGFSTTGKVYLSQLAEFPGDPAAWVSGRGDVERVCRERGYSCSGAVDYKAPESAGPTPDVAVAPDIINGQVDLLCAKDPSIRREDASERIEAMLSGRVSPWSEYEPMVAAGNLSNDEVGFN